MHHTLQEFQIFAPSRTHRMVLNAQQGSTWLICIWTLGDSLKVLGHPASRVARYQRAFPNSSNFKCFGRSVEMCLMGPSASHSEHWTKKRQVNIKTLAIHFLDSSSYLVLPLLVSISPVCSLPRHTCYSHCPEQLGPQHLTAWFWKLRGIGCLCPCRKPNCRFKHSARFKLNASWWTEPASGTPRVDSHKSRTSR